MIPRPPTTAIDLRDARRKFCVQRRCVVNRRGIQWKLTFEEWLHIWIASGKYHERGRGRGQYQMARYNDEGPYSLGNVRIITREENDAEKQLSAEVRERISAKLRGSKNKPSFLGHKHSEATRAKMSAASKEAWARKRAQAEASA